MIALFIGAIVFAVTPDQIDWPRLLTLAALSYSAGATVYSLLRLLDRFREVPTRLWAARVLLRLCSLGLFYFALDAMLQSWGDPVRVRVPVLFAVLLVYPWAIAELTADVLRQPGTTRRDDDPPDLRVKP